MSKLNYETHDDWLADVRRRSRRLPPAYGTPVDDETAKTTTPVPDADQGSRGSPPSVEKKRSADAWLMALRDESKGERAGADYYDAVYGDD
jgi:hypothetical protein